MGRRTGVLLAIGFVTLPTILTAWGMSGWSPLNKETIKSSADGVQSAVQIATKVEMRIVNDFPGAIAFMHLFDLPESKDQTGYDPMSVIPADVQGQIVELEAGSGCTTTQTVHHASNRPEHGTVPLTFWSREAPDAPGHDEEGLGPSEAQWRTVELSKGVWSVRFYADEQTGALRIMIEDVPDVSTVEERYEPGEEG